ncbi:hypothetical protein [Sporosarcina cyprini]|uniref:hypothetical protein n=1 Tax=Sporosarcina cyprini TaxID=2910523 RepID=UPI001EDCBDF3|nr:hypothetical protein [Sporosarcina cyprini]MCG3087106.1 hypothetical protein [Sporosarcina cyprini]
MAFNLSYWRSAQVIGVQLGLLAFNSGYWRSTRVIGVQLGLLAFSPGYWRSARVIGVQPGLLAFSPGYWRSNGVIGVQISLLAFALRSSLLSGVQPSPPPLPFPRISRYNIKKRSRTITVRGSFFITLPL